MAETPPFFMSLWDEIAADGDEFLTEFGREIKFRNQSIVALIDTNPIEETLGDGGFVYKSGYRVRLLAKEGSVYFLAPPRHGESMNIYNDQYTIRQVTRRPPSPWIDVFVIASNQ